jgi:mycothiol synthase
LLKIASNISYFPFVALYHQQGNAQEHPMTDLSIRLATSDDYEGIADLLNTNNPPVPAVAATLRETDQKRPDYCKSGRWMAEQDGVPIGLGMFEQSIYAYDPLAAQVLIVVHPDFQGQGIGQALYRTIEQAAQEVGIEVLRGGVNEDKLRALDFVFHLGYTEERRVFESTLEVSTFDPTPFEDLLSTLASEGIEIRPYSDIKGDPALDRAIYTLITTTLVDIPIAVPYTLPPFELFYKELFENPTVPHEGILLALSGDEVVGITYHRAYNDEQMNINYSGVRRDYRGRRLALALKVAGAAFARTTGTRILRTSNDSTNPSILAVNRKLGFVPRPASLILKKQLMVDSKRQPTP